MADDPGQQLVPAKDVEHSTFVGTFTVREKGRRYEVAANAIANRAMMQVNVAKLRSLCERAIKPYLDDPQLPVSAKELKVMADAFELVEAMSDRTYSDSKTGGSLANALEKLVYSATKGAAAGAVEGKLGSHSPEVRRRRMRELVAKAKPVTQEAEIMEVDEGEKAS